MTIPNENPFGPASGTTPAQDIARLMGQFHAVQAQYNETSMVRASVWQGSKPWSLFLKRHLSGAPQPGNDNDADHDA